MVLLDPNPGALRPAATDGPAIDSVAEDRAAGTPENLREDLIHLLGDSKVLHKLSDLVRYASDASPYRFVPQVVVIAETADDVAAVLRYAREHDREIVFRAAGTSLNGQSQGTDILVSTCVDTGPASRCSTGVRRRGSSRARRSGTPTSRWPGMVD